MTTPPDQQFIVRLEAARLDRARTLVRRMLVVVPVVAVAVAVVAVVALTRFRVTLVVLSALLVTVLLIALAQAVLRRRTLETLPDAAGVLFAVDDQGLYVGRLRQTVPWQSMVGIAHLDRSATVRRTTSRRVFGVGARFVAATGGHSHHLTVAIRDARALREAVPAPARSAVGVDRGDRGRVVLLLDQLLAPEVAVALLTELERRATARGIPFRSSENMLAWGAAVTELEARA